MSSPTSPTINSAKRTLDLARSFAAREILGRYKSSALGAIWLVLTPLFMLILFGFVFSVIFQARWPDTEVENRGSFAIVLFSGLLLYTFLSEALVRAPSSIIQLTGTMRRTSVNFEVAPISILIVSATSLGLNTAVFILAYPFVMGAPPISALWAPLAMIPLAFFMVGITFALAAIGIYLRDTVHVVNLMSMGLLFLSPVFYDIETVADPVRNLVLANPLTVPIINVRAALFSMEPASLIETGIHFAVSVAVAVAGVLVYFGLRPGFDDRL